MTESLSYAEKKILAAYREFYGENYTPFLNQKNTDIHVKVHKMCYFLCRRNHSIVETGFIWNTFGPFSICLQEMLKQFDNKIESLQIFYQNYKKDEILDTDLLEEIQKLRTGLDIPDGCSRRWIELLASLSFLAHSELPTSDFHQINSVLKYRKASYIQDDENKRAWDLLNALKVAY